MDDGVANLIITVPVFEPLEYIEIIYRLPWWEMANNNQRKTHGLPLLRRVHLRKATRKIKKEHIIQEDVKIE